MMVTINQILVTNLNNNLHQVGVELELPMPKCKNNNKYYKHSHRMHKRQM